jgi:signal transduction histidine kinase
MVSEFPILRSCVIRLWLRSSGETPADLEDVIRFDEALDRALTESVGEFMDRLNRSRDTFLGILSHDLRDPLATVITGGKLLLEEDLDAEETRDLVRRIVDTGERMHHLVADLLDAIRTQLGGQMPIQRRDADLAETIRRIVEEFATAHRGRSVKLSVSGDLRGQWDERRVGQAVANLVNNALRHGSPGTPVDISITGGPVVAIAIHNEGPPIPEEQRVSLFEPFRGAGDGASAANASRRPNLGLYIANAIVEGHHGRIDVDSTAERGTTFTIHLPRRTVA